MKSSFGKYLKAQLKFSLLSPLFYLVSILFLVFITINFFIRQQFFSGTGSSDLVLYFSTVPYISILVIPALCFRTSYLIYDSFVPLKYYEKLLCRFLSILILYSIELILLIPGCLCVNLFGQIDFGQLFTSIICLLFYAALGISFSLFISDFFENKISAFIISTIFLMIFHTAHLISVYISLPYAISEFLKQISFAWHFDAAGKGIIDTRDIIFYSVFTLIFLFLNDFFNKYRNGKKYNRENKFKILGYSLILVLIFLNSTRWYFRLDLSSDKNYTLSKYTTQLLKKIDEPVKLTYYRSSSLAKLYPQIRDVSDFLTIYSGKNKNIKLSIKTPEKIPGVIELLENYGITGQQLRNVKANSTEFINVYSAIIIEYQGKVEAVPFTMSAETLEFDLDSRIKYLISNSKRLVNIIIGNELNIYDDYNYLVPWLNSQGFTCNLLFLEDKNFTWELNSSYGPLLVIGDSRINIDQAIAIENYILSEKGNVIFAVSPYSVDIENDWSITANTHTNIVEMLENWGIQFLPEFTADISCSRITMYSDDENSNDFSQSSGTTKILNYPLWVNALPQKNSKAGVTLFWPVTLNVQDSKMIYLASTAAAYSIPADKNSPNRLIETNPFLLQEAKTSNYKKETKILAAEISGELQGLFNYGTTKNSKIIVIPDAYFLNSLMLGYNSSEYADYRNFDFVTNVLLKLNGEEDLAEIQNRNIKDKTLYKITSGVSFFKMEIITLFVLLILIPILIILFGISFKIANGILIKKSIKFINKAKE